MSTVQLQFTQISKLKQYNNAILTVAVFVFDTKPYCFLGERYTPGVGEITTEEMIRKEIIQLLCVEPLSHSALNKVTVPSSA
jgi:hypothetical protein